ncbi:hypothetical protein B0H19DRAFT_1057208 [Mycena capillaripes]|nr:hypothetical protein B0H19DRAFT_1057208 [Mycena capillaripes]
MRWQHQATLDRIELVLDPPTDECKGFRHIPCIGNIGVDPGKKKSPRQSLIIDGICGGIISPNPLRTVLNEYTGFEVTYQKSTQGADRCRSLGDKAGTRWITGIGAASTLSDRRRTGNAALNFMFVSINSIRGIFVRSYIKKCTSSEPHGQKSPADPKWHTLVVEWQRRHSLQMTISVITMEALTHNEARHCVAAAPDAHLRKITSSI